MVSQEQVGKAIVRLRKSRGLSQEKFALESGVDRRYISDIENGKRNVSLDLLNRVAGFFGISLSYLIQLAEHSLSLESVDGLRAFLEESGATETVYFTEPDFLDAIIGINEEQRLVYSFSRMVECLMLADNLSYEDAVEFIEYNTVRALPYMGKSAPIIVYDIP